MQKILNQNHGFQLIELLITLMIVGILASISMPIYSNYLTNENRMEAAAVLSTLAIALEQYQIEHNSYRDATLPALHFSEIIANRHYRLQIQSATDDGYVIMAEPMGKQAERDSACGSLLLDSTGDKKISGLGKINECW